MSPSWISLKKVGVSKAVKFGWSLWLRFAERGGNLPIVTQDDNTNIISFQVEGHTLDTAAELNHLSGLDLGETENSGDTISNRDHSTELLQIVLHNKGSIKDFGW